ncbi:MAG: aminotransferase class I/II-fold pyridoxal phosphate-dependent enzyme, partial [Candidatus Dormibacteraeota bacterium]|nr:aminotransferase class I/II-fold pyridoxal phosphate-dependent enzyme [Candidatus Dormibacteraeota bacterium]
MTERQPGFATRSVHAGQDPDLQTGAVVPPIHMATTFLQDGVGNLRGFEYGRTGNPTRQRLEECLAALEEARHCCAFSSGMAATAAVMMLLEPGDHVVLTDDVYGGTYRLLDAVLSRFGLRFTSVDASDLAALNAACEPSTKLLWVESPTNPLLRVVDIAAAAHIAHEHGALLAVDSTFASPALQRPLALGADIVVHSSTKFLGGHSDVLGGAVLTSDDSVAERVRFQQNAVGAVPSPFDCWLLLRGIRTLEVRVRRQSESALTIAHWLLEHPLVQRVHYPGVAADGARSLAERQMLGGFGGVLSFDVSDAHRAKEVLAKLRLITLAESLGAVESLAESPALMTHASV